MTEPVPVDGGDEPPGEIGGADDDALWDACPVTCVGQRNGIYYFLSAAGEWREFSVRDFSPAGIMSLFNGDRQWLAKKFPAFDKNGQETGDFVGKTATAGLMRECAKRGLWSAETPIRGVGVWRGEKPDDPVVVHCGDVLMICEIALNAVPAEGAAPARIQFVAAGKRWKNAIYPSAPEMQRPATPLPTKDDVRGVLDALGLWNYAIPAGARLLLGFIVLGALGAAPEWRVNALLTSERGGGKTTLARFIRRLLGAQSAALNDFTEAGLRQTFTRAALTYILDEAEGDIAFNRIDQVIQFLRRMTGEEGLMSVRGSAGGHAQQFSASSPALLSAINPPAMLPQDRSRFLLLELGAADPKNRGKVLAAMTMADKVSPGFRARAAAGWPRFRANLALYHDELMRGGCDPRQADKFSALLAASDMMLFDEPADSEGVSGAVADIADLIAETIAEDEEAGDSRQCLATLMTRQVEHWRGGSKSTIGRLISNAINENSGEDGRALRVYGLRVEAQPTAGGKQWWLFVANQHEGLSAIFRETRWRAGAWKTALLRLPGASRSKAPIRFDGVKERATQIPGEFLPVKPPGPAPRPGSNEFDDVWVKEAPG